MRVVLQRVTSAAVRADEETVGAIGRGLVAFVGVAEGDTEDDARRLATKTAELRVFPDEEGRFNRSLVEVGGEALVVSQFTLYGDVRRGRRPSFVGAARPEVAEPLVDEFARALRAAGLRVACGRFGAHMDVDVFNDGPVTILLDTEDLDRPRRAKS